MTLEGMVPFPPDFAEEYRKAGYWKDVPLGTFFAGVFAKYAERVAVVSGAEKISYREVGERVERLALHLHRIGLRPLDRVVVQLPNVPEFVYLYFALQRVGAIPLMALPAHRYLEISSFVELTGAVAYVIPDRLGDTDLVALAARV
ncbi:MAG: AMP-binding protein, partial [bacterium]